MACLTGSTLQNAVRPLAMLLAALLCACAPATRAPAPAAPTGAASTSLQQTPPSPDLAYPELFQAVQLGRLFADQKQFVDALPLRDPARIRADYLDARGRSGFDLHRFVQANFQLPQTVDTPLPPAGFSLRRHIDALWPALIREHLQVPPHSSQLPLPHPYVVPGGRFGEMYYWDSYFTMLGLVESGQALRARHMLDNFAHLVDRHGHIPNGTRTYYLSRSQPPFFSHMVELQAHIEGPAAYRRYLPQLQAEHAYWMRGHDAVRPGQASARVVRLHDGTLLNRYWDDRDTPRPESYLQDRETAAAAPHRDPAQVYRDLRAAAESGWDFSTRWLGDRRTLATIRTTSIVPVDLNSLLHHLEHTLATACALPQAPPCEDDYAALARQRRQAIEKHLWNAGGAHYADFDWQSRRVGGQLTAAALYPLFTGVASAPRARTTAAAVQAQLLLPGGLVPTAIDSGQQWDAPNAWAPLQWVAVRGLRRYGEDTLAREIGTRYLGQVQALFRTERRLVEKYDASAIARGGGGGEYPLQDGFGWTNAVTLKLLAMYPDPLVDGRPAPASDTGDPTSANVSAPLRATDRGPPASGITLP